LGRKRESNLSLFYSWLPMVIYPLQIEISSERASRAARSLSDAGEHREAQRSFLAWQKKPGAGAENMLHANLLDAGAVASLTTWLKAVFA
jgi:hypothetical protein